MTLPRTSFSALPVSAVPRFGLGGLTLRASLSPVKLPSYSLHFTRPQHPRKPLTISLAFPPLFPSLARAAKCLGAARSNEYYFIILLTAVTKSRIMHLRFGLYASSRLPRALASEKPRPWPLL